ncbi:hypothetical protein COM89_26180 [Bacillus thuringiensis]|nr:hypothetical protein COM89_26180 [Bacillus thuringiensis]
MKCPQNDNFIILQLFMRIQLDFFVLRSNQFLNLMGRRQNPIYINLTMIRFLRFIDYTEAHLVESPEHVVLKNR